ncbi:MAG: DUF1905 domain-containing protein [Clostridiales bacterium]|jgi:hypothetical protein|nr:DUF1905 domain-containing protein [Clostridiales bacterium]
MSIRFEASLSNIAAINLIKMPQSASELLPSRGMMMAEGTVNGIPFTAPLEPDGRGSHWFEASHAMIKEAGLKAGKPAAFDITPTIDWPEPEISPDILDALRKSNLMPRWDSLTVKARWDWLRWIRATKNLATRQKRIDVTLSKLQVGDNNPCCFDRTRCTIPEVSKSGVLID